MIAPLTRRFDDYSAEEIRAAMREFVLCKTPSAGMFNELPLCRGEGRADLAAVSNCLVGYEIKSAKDSLTRLKLQIPRYEKIFDYNYVVVTRKHLRAARAAVPLRWGVLLVQSGSALPQIHTLRLAARNANIDRFELVRLLWKTEAIQI